VSSPCKIAMLAAVALAVSACGQWDGINSLPLPGGRGHDDGAFSVTIDMPDVSTLSRNSPVLVNDVAVGSITDMQFEDWHARVTITLERDVELPANAVAKVGQTSLLGSKHLQLSAPTSEAPSVVPLRDGDSIPLERAGAYPTTEQTLSALSVVLNGGGIAQISDIVHEANAAIGGRGEDVRDLIAQLGTTTTLIDDRKSAIVSVLDSLDRIGSQFAADQPRLDAALAALAPAAQLLEDNRTRLSDTLAALQNFSDSANSVVSASREDLAANIENLVPVLKGLADAGDSLTRSLNILFTFPFAVDKVDRVARGDFTNLFAILDLSVPRLQDDLLRGTPLGRSIVGAPGVLGISPGVASDNSDPRTAPLTTAPPNAEALPDGVPPVLIPPDPMAPALLPPGLLPPGLVPPGLVPGGPR
jgi:phospholipid/cholesterol/gamma-HCH transport system substrate-binding protein